MHPDVSVTANAKANQPSLSSFDIGASSSRPCTDSRQGKITGLLAKVIITKMLSIVISGQRNIQRVQGMHRAELQGPLSSGVDGMKTNVTKKVTRDLSEATGRSVHDSD